MYEEEMDNHGKEKEDAKLLADYPLVGMIDSRQEKPILPFKKVTRILDMDDCEKKSSILPSNSNLTHFAMQ
ncbi:hypothetical protein SDJN02_22276 [Cucurbita argyrosperma subsp. argyrosperma]|nr:hypothetical protein SDJN02_22276 [Cucurbita argyrosperma subsp. argyrosperma]